MQDYTCFFIKAEKLFYRLIFFCYIHLDRSDRNRNSVKCKLTILLKQEKIKNMWIF
ncbi:hypothetical protein HMPREF9406_3194 [Clostridium sp. HGF2]|nr:hypothetical protein HMPREF9406_3194 [Clostridium sp. HGF2]EQJ59562.1 hypothetical protein QSI_1433 [Clostridioides difficile P28]